jgi:4-hydroxy-L-threonine phosphate dehydrogenase PdxA
MPPLFHMDNLVPLVVTAGEPAGIGPDLCVMLAQVSPRRRLLCCWPIATC